ncbi:hypothetical protein ED312_05440 [Sinomicrobium pectinilyticum]|uniref:Uncharacterized protein n=1 Tax=Sinomicrobium pectinilyticum TaxID=1084421 RepID=A0A3N0ERU7_SINP1|nr:hypothetical protein ED312_05440 [Sinomicrobium pectinilyticum]
MDSEKRKFRIGNVYSGQRSETQYAENGHTKALPGRQNRHDAKKLADLVNRVAFYYLLDNKTRVSLRS